MIYEFIYASSDLLIQWFIDWLIDWLFDWLSNSLIYQRIKYVFLNQLADHESNIWIPIDRWIGVRSSASAGCGGGRRAAGGRQVGKWAGGQSMYICLLLLLGSRTFCCWQNDLPATAHNDCPAKRTPTSILMDAALPELHDSWSSWNTCPSHVIRRTGSYWKALEITRDSLFIKRGSSRHLNWFRKILTPPEASE